MGLRLLVTDDGREPFATRFDRLDTTAAAKVTVALVRFGEGKLSRTKPVGQGVLEYRIDWGPGYRVCFGRDGATLVILLTGGTKRSAGSRTSSGRRRSGRNTGVIRGARIKRRQPMALTRSFKDLVQRRVAEDPAFGEALLREAIDTMLAGDVDTAKTVLRDYIKATVGFAKLSEETGTPPKSLIRMFGPRGNPQAGNLFSVIGCLQRRAGVTLRVTVAR